LFAGNDLVNKDFGRVDRLQSIDGHRLLDIHIRDVNKRADRTYACIQEKHCNVDVFDFVSNPFAVLLDRAQFVEVGNNSSCLDLRVLCNNLLKFLINFRLSATDDADVESLCCHLVTDLKADSVGSTSNQDPGVGLAVPRHHVVSWIPSVSLEESKRRPRPPRHF